MRSIRGIIKVGYERDASHTDTVTQTRLFLEEGPKVQAFWSSNGPSQDGSGVPEAKSALMATKLELQAIPSFVKDYLM